jgi:hypothetical protein
MAKLTKMKRQSKILFWMRMKKNKNNKRRKSKENKLF